MMTPEKLKELKDITIDFNEYLETVTMNLEHLQTGIRDIVANIQTEIDELAEGTSKIIGDMRKDLEQERTVISEFVKTVNSLRSTSSTISPLTSTSSAKPITSRTIQIITSASTESSSSLPFLEKEKEMLELIAQLLSKRTIQSTTQARRFVLFDICDSFF